ncbi:SLA1 and SHD1 interacting domain-containing protein [Rozella allomycis CSF55]|uniref:Actin cytoskeleton-regulatory complex protein SLA1 n=1 Tax=Rozella allomycis (strain CSF55) TaxID=988480 RepID=A0A075B2P8_ROZAC|nr:SLA1 and SHD1 interacting domain-containing protein [Rozella allomycis CSF55]|eukprot:EPZ36842.1 SLA1 and SHD1 interacting domain-containing protein [Rozella allomycis CSF55]
MIFIDVARALYDYASDYSEELSFKQDDVLFITSKEDPDWYYAYLDGAEGFVPFNYIEVLQPSSDARCLFDYCEANNEELSFREGDLVTIYDTRDDNWWIACLKGRFGFVPANYVEIQNGGFSEQVIASFDSPMNDGQFDQVIEPVENQLKIQEGNIETQIQAEEIVFLKIIKFVFRERRMNILSFDVNKDVVALKLKEEVIEFTLVTQSDIEILKNRLRNVTGEKEEKVKKVLANKIGDKESEEKIEEIRNKEYKNEEVKNKNEVFSSNVVTENVKTIQSTPKIVFAKVAYEAKRKEEISIKENENFIVIDDSDSEWWKVKAVSKKGREGFVPSSCLELKQKLIIQKENKLEIIQENKVDKIEKVERIEQLEKIEKIVNPAIPKRSEIQSPEKIADKLTIKTDFAPPPLPPRSNSSSQNVSPVAPPLPQRGSSPIVKEEIKPAVEVFAPPLPQRVFQDTRVLKEEKESSLPVLPSRPKVDSTMRSNQEVKPIETQKPSEFKSEPIIPKPPRNVPINNPNTRNIDSNSNLNTNSNSNLNSNKDSTPSLIIPPRKSSASKPPSSPTRRTLPQRPTEQEVLKPRPSNIRIWKDKSETFKVEAEYLGLSDNKVVLFKTNGVKIAVPIEKLSVEDIKYVESLTGKNFNQTNSIELLTPKKLDSDIKSEKNEKKAKQMSENNMSEMSEKKQMIEMSEKNKISDFNLNENKLNQFNLNERKQIVSSQTNQIESNEQKQMEFWMKFFSSAGISNFDSKQYAEECLKRKFDEKTISTFSRELLKELNIGEGDIQRIKKILPENHSLNVKSIESLDSSFSKTQISPLSSRRSSRLTQHLLYQQLRI